MSICLVFIDGTMGYVYLGGVLSVRRGCVRGSQSRKLRDTGCCLLQGMGACRKVAAQNRMVTSLMKSCDPMTS